MGRKIAEWWNGTWVDNPPGARVIFVCRTYHPTSIWAHACVDYLRKHHRWVIGVTIAAIGLFTKLK
jgi:hypothetical protein